MGSVEIQIKDGVMTATLADVENRNALGAELVGGLFEALTRANADDAIRALVITNVGNTFCAGANLKQQSASPGSGTGTSRQGGFENLLDAIQKSATPVIGRIDGHAVGGGMGLAAALDISIASKEARFGFTEVRLGVVPAIISVVCLPKLRRADAMEAFLRGHRFSAKRAAKIGLINRAVEPRDLDDAVAEVLDDLRKAGPNALGFAKRLVNEVPRMEEAEAFRWTAQLSAELFAGEEAAEGMAAFLGKRTPRWAEKED